MNYTEIRRQRREKLTTEIIKLIESRMNAGQSHTSIDGYLNGYDLEEIDFVEIKKYFAEKNMKVWYRQVPFNMFVHGIYWRQYRNFLGLKI